MKLFCFGLPDWSESKGPVSWVPFPFKEWDALGRRADILYDWKPNDRLKEYYHKIVEENTGIRTDYSRPQ